MCVCVWCATIASLSSVVYLHLVKYFSHWLIFGVAVVLDVPTRCSLRSRKPTRHALGWRSSCYQMASTETATR